MVVVAGDWRKGGDREEKLIRNTNGGWGVFIINGNTSQKTQISKTTFADVAGFSSTNYNKN